ncbi:hypothetical protein C8R41DRAFT_919051 [Lentinula lateritia]|uniref:Zn(2)-C6 fungal-type domain-containing protein n=1 Tax=Lentinula lateritia TaxID=40482 RepID=A0ABQ8VI62_9AGAR|nr:hypothetical protein C8R41DRAFT_919051 [Lentinula lateritia]
MSYVNGHPSDVVRVWRVTEEEDLEEDEEEILRRAQERVRRVKERKAAIAAKKRAEVEAAQKAKEAARKKKESEARELEERRRRLAGAATACSRRGSSPGESSVSPRRPVVEITKRKGKAKAQPVDEDPDDGGDGGDDDDDEEERAPCERCRSKKISCQMQAGKRSSIICKPCHDAKVKCSYSGQPSTVKQEGGGHPTNERLAVLESQVAQLLADNRQLRDGQVKANTYHRHMNRKLDWLVTDASRRRRTPPELPEAGPSGLSKKRRRLVDSDEEEEQGLVEEKVGGEDGEGEEEVEEEEKEGEAPALKKAKTAASEKGKEKEVVEVD